MINYNDIKYEHNISSNYLTASMSNIIKYFIICLVLILVILGIIIVVKKIKNKEKVITKEDKMKFIDVMTSLKIEIT